LAVLPGPQLVFLDFGQMGRLEPWQKEQFINWLILSIFRSRKYQ
jgi:predicted unusual protein kinase regulating ubiquinone biosynthesis (AarF/ABC1/UbiB family)